MNLAKVFQNKKFLNEGLNSKQYKWAYGTRIGKWYLIDKNDRDWDCGITNDEFKRLGSESAKQKYLGAVRV